MSPSAIIQWLDRVSDSFDAFVAFNDSDEKLTPGLRILYAGLALEEETASAWWSENRAALKALTKWDDFVDRVLTRFAPDGWKARSLRSYYLIQQQSRPYTVFAAELQTARSSIGTTGKLGITDRIHINHLLFRAHDMLQRRVLAIPGFDLESITVDELTSLMSATWDSLMGEGLVRQSTQRTTLSTSIPATPAPAAPYSVASRLPLLDDAEKKRISDAGGCWKCRKTPTSPGWTPHIGRTCPGDASLGIPPGRDFVAVKTEAVATILSFPDDAELQPHLGEDQPEHFTVAYTSGQVAADPSYRDGNNESDSDEDGY